MANRTPVPASPRPTKVVSGTAKTGVLLRATTPPSWGEVSA
jgi:hypothetical protein